MYVYMCVCMYGGCFVLCYILQVYMYVCIYVCMYVWGVFCVVLHITEIHVCSYIRVYVCMWDGVSHVYINAGACACVRVYMHACM